MVNYDPSQDPYNRGLGILPNSIVQSINQAPAASPSVQALQNQAASIINNPNTPRTTNPYAPGNGYDRHQQLMEQTQGQQMLVPGNPGAPQGLQTRPINPSGMIPGQPTSGINPSGNSATGQVGYPQPLGNQQIPQSQASWNYNPQAQYALHDQQQNFINSLHNSYNTTEARSFQKGISAVNWSDVGNSIEAHKTAMANSPADLGYVGNHGVQNAVTSAANGGSYMDIASGMLGKTAGNDTKTLSAFFQKSGMGNVNPSTTAWCAAFANSALQSGGIQGTHSLAANSFKTWGDPVKPTEATRGDVVVFHWAGQDPSHGHVAFVDHISDDGKTVYALGGNQSHSVSIQAYPMSRVSAIRHPPSGDEIKEKLTSNSQQTLPAKQPPRMMDDTNTDVPGISPEQHSNMVNAIDKGLSYE